MKIAKQIDSVLSAVTPAKKRIREIVGFAELQFIDENGNVLIVGRGYTIKVKTFKNVPTFVVNAPAYKSGFGYKTSFIVEDKSLWMNISNAILEDFRNQTGDLKPEDYISEDINPDDIPF